MKALSIIGIILSPSLCFAILTCLDDIMRYRQGNDPRYVEFVVQIDGAVSIFLSLFLLAISIVGVVTGHRYNRLKRNNNSNQD